MTMQSFGRYEIINELGHGGMATVYRARDPIFDRIVAVKVLPVSLTAAPNFRLRFEREAKTVAALDHPAIVPIFDYGEEAGQPFMVMRYMSGGSLAERLKEGGLTITEIQAIMKRMCQALDHAHQQGIVHRDIKPANILFDQYGEACLADFGVVHLSQGDAALTATGAIIGTPAYMSPEQIQGDKTLDGRSDIYALGVVLFEMLTGQQPFRSDTPTKTMFAHITEPVPRVRQYRSGLPAGVEVVIDRALAKDREQRFPTAAALAAAIDQLGRASHPGVVSAAHGQENAVPFSSTNQLSQFPAETDTPGSQSGGKRRLGRAGGWIIGLLLLIAILWGWGSGFFATIFSGGVPANEISATRVVTLTPVGNNISANTVPRATATFAPTFTPAPTSLPTETPTLTPSVTPTPTSTPPPVIMFAPFSLTTVANGEMDFASPPTGQTTFHGVPFQMDSRIFKSQASPVPHNTAPTSAMVSANLMGAYRLHLLLTAGNGFQQFDGLVIGRVVAVCDGTSFTVRELQLGRDVREWHSAANVVSTATAATQVWQGALIDHPDLQGQIDMLSFDLPLACQTGNLTAVEVVDSSIETTGSLDPALNFIALTVEYLQ